MPTTLCAVRRLKNQQLMLLGEIRKLENEQYAIWTRAEVKREKLAALLGEIHARQRASIMAKQPARASRQKEITVVERIDTMLAGADMSLDELKALLCEPDGLAEYKNDGKDDGIRF